MKLAVQFGHFNVLVNNAAGVYGLLAGGGSPCHFFQCLVAIWGVLVLKYPSLGRYRGLFIGDLLVSIIIGIVSYDSPVVPSPNLIKRVAVELTAHSASFALEQTIFTTFALLAFLVRIVPIYFLYSFK